jgi:hypothetical protein
MMLKYVFAFLLIMHGLAHITGILGTFVSGEQAFSNEPWIFSRDITVQSTLGKAWSLVWLLALIALVGTGIGLLFGQEWWPSLAVAAAAISLVAIIPWLRVVPPGAYAGALLDAAIVVVLLTPWANRVVAAVG